MKTLVLLAVALFAGGAEKPAAFQPGEKGYFTFDTGQLRGRMRLDGKSQGLCSVVYTPSGMELAKVPGLLSYYRIFSAGARYGNAARDWPVSGRIVEGGALEIRFPPADDHPLEITGLFRWRSADTLDLETTVKAVADLPRVEVFLSSYFVPGFGALVYVKPNRFSKGKPPSFMPPDWSEMIDGNYLIFPRDREDLLMIYDGRWEFPPSPVTWAFTRYLAAPIAVRRNAEAGLTAVLMSPPDDCFAVGTPYNKKPPDGVAGHDSLYLSLFGRDLPAGQTARAHCRLLIAKDLSDEAILQRYGQYLAERGVKPAPAKPVIPEKKKQPAR